MRNAEWSFLPGKLPRRGSPVLVVKDCGSSLIVREAVYRGKGYWQGAVNAPVLAWIALPLPPLALELRDLIKERDALLDKVSRFTDIASPQEWHARYGYVGGRTPREERRLIQIERKIERATEAREDSDMRFIRLAAKALRRVKDGEEKG